MGSGKLAGGAATLSVAALAVLTLPARAEECCFYLGANALLAKAKIDDDRIASDLLDGGLTTTAIDDDDQDAGYEFVAGYRFTRHFALQVGYFDLGEFGFVATTEPAGTVSGAIQVKGVDLDAVGFVPFTPRLSASGHIGASYAEAEATFVGTGAAVVLDPNPSQSSLNFKFGLGLEYEFTQSLALRSEAEFYRIDDAVGNIGDFHLLSVGLIYRFGGKELASAARVPPSSAIEHAPVRVAVPAQARNQKPGMGIGAKVYLKMSPRLGDSVPGEMLTASR